MNIEEVWSEYRHGLKSFLHSRVADADEVDDLLQEVLVKTYEKLPTVRDGGSIKSWLFQVANNTIIDFYRSRAREGRVDAADLWYDDDAELPIDMTRCVEPFIRALPEETARLLTAIDIEGRSQKEYAEELGVSYSTLKSRVQKGRSELRRLFDQCCKFTLDESGNLVEIETRSGGCEDCP